MAVHHYVWGPLSDSWRVQRACPGEPARPVHKPSAGDGVECAPVERGASRMMNETRRTTQSVLWTEPPIPEDLTQRHGLFCLYALQQWECLRQPREGPYKPGYFYHSLFGV